MQRWVGPFRIASEQNPNVYTLAELDGVHYANPTSGDRLAIFSHERKSRNEDILNLSPGYCCILVKDTR